MRHPRWSGLGVARLFFAEFLQAGEASFVEVARLDRGSHGAAGFPVVAAIAEPALRDEAEDIVEDVLDAIVAVRKLELPHSGIVDEHPAGRQQVE